jgi:hypothetical protein
MLHGKLIPGTLVQRIVSYGLSPTELLFNKPNLLTNSHDSGVVDSLRYLVMHEQFLKPYSDEYIIASLLVKAF